MRILITYHTETRNTQLLANTLYEHLSKNHQVGIKETDKTTPSSLNDYDLVFIGSPCHSSDIASSVKKLLHEIPKNPNYKLAGFYCHSTYKRDHPNPIAEAMFDQWAADGKKHSTNYPKKKTPNY